MTRRTAAAGAVIGAGLVLGLTGCAGSFSSGPRVTEDRAIADVRAVELRTGGDLTVRRGSTPSLRITAGEQTQERLTAEVRGGVLVLDTDRGWFGGIGSVSYELVLPELQGVKIAGSGDVTGSDVTGDDLQAIIEGSGSLDLDRIDAENVELSIEGSGDVELAGTASAADLSIEGSGEIDGSDLNVREADVSIEGSGDVELAVSDRLGISISGSGSMTYFGDPRVTSNVSGSGDVRQG